MPTGYQIKEQDKPYFITLQVVYWIDIFSRQKYRDIIIKNPILQVRLSLSNIH